MHPALVTEVSKEEFDGMAKVLKKLGPIKSMTMTAIRVNGEKENLAGSVGQAPIVQG